MMGVMLPLILLLASSLAPAHVEVSAAYQPPSGSDQPGRIAVHFFPRDPAIRVNRQPAPRLKLEREDVLVHKPAPAAPAPVMDPEEAGYFESGEPVLFPVGVAPDASKGSHLVKARVTYFYCSKSEGWCRRTKEDLELAVALP